MKLEIRLLFWITPLILSGCGISCNYCSDKSTTATPKTEFEPTAPHQKAYQQIADLNLLIIALEKYKMENHQYPISSNNGRGYDAVISDQKNGIRTIEWIKGLAPRYINKLPNYPSSRKNQGKQYLYRSDGANYKLIAGINNIDCDNIKETFPTLVDPRRNCWAIGYWTKNANQW